MDHDTLLSSIVQKPLLIIKSMAIGHSGLSYFVWGQKEMRRYRVLTLISEWTVLVLFSSLTFPSFNLCAIQWNELLLSVRLTSDQFVLLPNNRITGDYSSLSVCVFVRRWTGVSSVCWWLKRIREKAAIILKVLLLNCVLSFKLCSLNQSHQVVFQDLCDSVTDKIKLLLQCASYRPGCNVPPACLDATFRNW